MKPQLQNAITEKIRKGNALFYLPCAMFAFAVG